MSGIHFDEGGAPRPDVSIKGEKGLGKWLVDKGIAKNYEQSQQILFGVAVLAIILTGVVLMAQRTPSAPPVDESMYDEEMMMEEGAMMDGEY